MSVSTRSFPNEQQILDLCLRMRRLDLKLTPDQQHGSEYYARTHARRFALVLERLAPLVPAGARIFSVGSMPNQLELLLARFLPATVLGSTYSPQDSRDKFTAVYEHHDGWRCEMEVYLRDLTRQPLPVAPLSCDAVLCFEVVEHLHESPLPLFCEIRRALKPTGCILLSTPNMQHWHRVLHALNGMTYRDLDFSEPMESRHTHIFSRHELSQLLQGAGFEIVTEFSADPWENAKHQEQFDWLNPLNKAVLKLLGDREEFQHECLFLAARPALALPLLNEGWHPKEQSKGEWWCWTPGRGSLSVIAAASTTATLHGELYSLRRPNRLDILVNGNRHAVLDIDWDGFRQFPPVQVPLTAGENLIQFVSHNSGITLPTDARLLAIAVKNLVFQIGDKEQAVVPPQKNSVP